MDSVLVYDSFSVLCELNLILGQTFSFGSNFCHGIHVQLAPIKNTSLAMQREGDGAKLISFISDSCISWPDVQG